MMHLITITLNTHTLLVYMSGKDGTPVELSETTAEKDLGVIIANKLNFHEHVATAMFK